MSQTPRMKIGLLRDWIKVLQRVRDGKKPFNMGNWAVANTFDSITQKDICGTACCAAGEAALYPKFQKLGLNLTLNGKVYKTYTGLNKALMKHPGRGARVVLKSGKYVIESAEYAIAELFGLTYNEAANIVLPHTYDMPVNKIHPQHVIARIENMIKKEQKKRATRKWRVFTKAVTRKTK